MVPEHLNHCVRVKINPGTTWSIDERLVEVTQIRAWLDELTEWQPDAYCMKFFSQGTMLKIWFEHEQQAVACALKWS